VNSEGGEEESGKQ